VKPLNDFSVAFYKATQTLLQKLSLELEGFEYSLGNTYAMFTTMLKDPLGFGKQQNNNATLSITINYTYIAWIIILHFHKILYK
jgi:hypothetical protein